MCSWNSFGRMNSGQLSNKHFFCFSSIPEIYHLSYKVLLNCRKKNPHFPIISFHHCLVVQGTLKGALGFLIKENRQLNDMTQKQATEVTMTQVNTFFWIFKELSLRCKQSTLNSFEFSVNANLMLEYIYLQTYCF